MAEQTVERKLSAILAADVVGYSRLMGADEEATLRTLDAYGQVIGEIVAAHQGRVFNSAGDSVMAEFASPVEAVRGAVEIQRALAERNAGLPEQRRMIFRIGINLGDVMVEGENLLGDGVNVAARLQEQAEPGGVDISGTVFDQVEHRLDLECQWLGRQRLKNIGEAVRTYRVALQPGPAEGIGRPRKTHAPRRVWAAIAAVFALAVTGFLVWGYLPGDPAPSVETALAPAIDPAVPAGPSVAILPFANMSAGAEQDYFADGITEDLITDLSKGSGLFVIGRQTMFAYKDRPVTPQQLGETLGVHFVLEGSVRRSGNRVRINAQLSETETGRLLWADRYDGSLTDVFALQDTITRQIVAALADSLPVEGAAQEASTESGNPEAYDAFLKGWSFYRRNRPEDLAGSVPFFERAIRLDPTYGRAHAALAAVYWKGWRSDWTEALGSTAEEARSRADRHLEEAMKFPTPLAHQVAAQMLSLQGRHEAAIAHAERAIALDPSDPEGYQAMATAQRSAGKAPTGAYP